MSCRSFAKTIRTAGAVVKYFLLIRFSPRAPSVKEWGERDQNKLFFFFFLFLS